MLACSLYGQAPTEQQYLNGGGGGISNGGLVGQMATLSSQVAGVTSSPISVTAQHLPGNLNWVSIGEGTCDPSAQYGSTTACTWNNAEAMNLYTDALARAGIQGIDINFDPYKLATASQYLNALSAGNAAFGGSGLNDLAAGGPYTGAGNSTYRVVISSTGITDGFQWCSTPAGSAACTLGSPVAITAGVPQPLSDGIRISFGASAGHTMNDFWEITALASDCSAPPSWNCLTLANYDAMFAHVVATPALYGPPLRLRLRPKPDKAMGPCGISTASSETDLEACLKPLHVASVARWGSLLDRFTVIHEAFGGFGTAKIAGGRLMDIISVPIVTQLVANLAAAVKAQSPAVKVGAGAETMFNQDAPYFEAYLGIPGLNYVETDLYGSTCDVGLYSTNAAAKAASWAASAKAAGKEIVMGESARPRILSVNPPCPGPEESNALIGAGAVNWGADGADAAYLSTMIPWAAAQGYTLFTLFDGDTLIWYTTNVADSNTVTSTYPRDVMGHLASTSSTGTVLAQLVSGPHTLSAASGNSLVAPGSIVSIYGSSLASSTAFAKTIPLPTSLGGASATITDSRGASAALPLFYASPQQINAAIPASAQTGLATLTVNTPAGAVKGTVMLAAAAPGLFAANSSGKGLAAAQVVTNRPDGSQTTALVFQCSGPGNCAPVPIDLTLGPTALVLYGTGLGVAASLSEVAVTINGQLLHPFYAGPAPAYVGLDQVNVLLPATLAASGVVNVSVSVAGTTSNTLTVAFK